jgi:hypothetical protein
MTPTAAWRLIRYRVRRIGLLRLWRHPDRTRWAVSLDNRTYHHWFEIPPDRVARWRQEFDRPSEDG